MHFCAVESTTECAAQNFSIENAKTQLSWDAICWIDPASDGSNQAGADRLRIDVYLV